MAEYIEREAYVDLFKGEHNLYSWEEIEEFIDSIPAADVQPVVHGKWVDEGFYADGSAKHAFHCSNCGHHIIEWKDDTSNYCPNCGAIMDGET